MLVPPNISRRAALRSGLLFGLGASVPQAAWANEAPGLAAQKWPSVRSFIDSYVGTGKLAGAVSAMGFGTDAPDFVAAGHTAFGGQVTAGPDTLYRIYSMTKPVTGIAAMMCVEDGLLTLDQPISETLPAFADMKVQKTYDGSIAEEDLEPAKRPITIRQCLTHTAGLGYGVIQTGPIKQAYNDQGIVPVRITRLELPLVYRPPAAPSLEAFADRLAQMPLVYQPGQRWSYSVSLDLLGRIIEIVSGVPFGKFLEDRIFKPLGMDSTRFFVNAEDVGRFTALYGVVDDERITLDEPEDSIYLDEPAFPFGGAGLVSSARDYDRFLMMLANGGEVDGNRVLEQETVRLATSDILPDTLAPDGGFVMRGFDLGFGAGGFVGRGLIDGMFGWFGGGGTTGLVNMRWGLRQTMMTQIMPQDYYPIQRDFPLAVARDALANLGRMP